jgi:hypothetical protein
MNGSIHHRWSVNYEETFAVGGQLIIDAGGRKLKTMNDRKMNK